ncbi:YfbM family protein [Micromonospora inyonensis]|uniref:DUF1877 domain-containing protein n=1 Tax=Micromonospora inyonensis TaxID=47866 RepID=A0A1C6R785_9ACTN|nr:YfbM family protein [Micromonospora inyonensis]SCL12886.1 protein of unknown function [Micromonospora inyonensis]
MPATGRHRPSRLVRRLSEVRGILPAMGMIFVGRRLDAAEQQRLLTDHSRTADLIHGGNAPDLDLDKAWHAIHYLLAGAAWETTTGAGEAILGGDPIGSDVGYGSARLLGPAQVRAVAAGLEPVTVGTLRSRYDSAALGAADIYPDIWDDDEEEFDTYLAPYVDELRSFYLAAAGAGEAVLLAVV